MPEVNEGPQRGPFAYPCPTKRAGKNVRIYTGGNTPTRKRRESNFHLSKDRPLKACKTQIRSQDKLAASAPGNTPNGRDCYCWHVRKPDKNVNPGRISRRAW